MNRQTLTDVDRAVASPRSVRPRAPRALRVDVAGFTLIELMVCVLIVSIVCVLAVPSMSHEGYDRRAFTDASNVVEIVREARTRAVARGAAELLIMHAPGSGNTASFTLWEATSTITTGDAGFVSASSSCNPPTVWPNFTGYGSPGAATAAFVDEFQIGGANSLESQSQGNINMQVYDPTPTAVTTNLYLCFTPAGRSYYATGASPPAAGFVNALGSSGGVGAITVTVAAGTLSGVNGSNSTNLVRTVWIPPSGAASLTSQ